MKHRKGHEQRTTEDVPGDGGERVCRLRVRRTQERNRIIRGLPSLPTDTIIHTNLVGSDIEP